MSDTGERRHGWCSVSAFGTLRLHRVHLRVVASNIAATRCYEYCGFPEEGRDREAVLMNGQWHDHVRMGILDREFSDVAP